MSQFILPTSEGVSEAGIFLLVCFLIHKVCSDTRLSNFSGTSFLHFPVETFSFRHPITLFQFMNIISAIARLRMDIIIECAVESTFGCKNNPIFQGK